MVLSVYARLASTLLLLALAVALLVAPLVYKPLNVIIDPVHGIGGSGLYRLPEGTLRVEGVPGEAKVLWDSEGVPHVFATTDEAGFYAMGYVTASLRLFQADILRRIPQGRLSELVGEAGLGNDRLVRTLGVHEATRKSWEFLRASGDPELRRVAELIQYYVRGLNDYISRLDSRLLPPEYRLLGLKPEPWSPEDVIATQKLFTMMLAWDTDDLVLGELVRRWGLSIIVDLDVVGRGRTTPQALCADAIKWGDVVGLRAGGRAEDGFYGEAGLELPSSRSVLEALSNTIFNQLKLGSNNWVVSGLYSSSGKPIVANDPHLALVAPSLWMLVHIETPSLRVAGVTVPGSPLVIIGRNERVAWGFTNVMGDFADFYYYKWDGDRYLYRGSWVEAGVRVEEIKVWDPVRRAYRVLELKVLETVHGPVMEEGGERYAVAFTGSTPSFEIVFIWGINRATSVVEALRAQRFFTAPIQNLVVADSEGNIAYSPVGAYPLRVNLPVYEVGGVAIVNRGFLPFNGSNGEGEWAGFISYSELPILYNPPKPFIVTANSKPFDGDCGLHIGWNWADRFRQDRIVSLLEGTLRGKGSISVEDVMSIQTDDKVDLSFRMYISLLLRLAEKANLRSEILEGLRAWLNEGAPTTPDRWEPSVALAWSWFFHRSLWAKLYGGEGNLGFFRLEHAERLLELYLEGDPKVYRYLRPGEAENLTTKAYEKAIETLKTYYGGDYRSWLYGSIHYYDPQHLIIKTYSYEKVETGGGPYSVNPSTPAELGALGAPARSGASVRLVSDLSTNKIHIALPGGNHGNPHSLYYQNHYKNYWAKKTYYTVELGVEPPAIAQLTIRG
jgi:Protein related to penicillin acylase